MGLLRESLRCCPWGHVCRASQDRLYIQVPLCGYSLGPDPPVNSCYTRVTRFTAHMTRTRDRRPCHVKTPFVIADSILLLLMFPLSLQQKNNCRNLPLYSHLILIPF